ncbi:hypothetical protein RI129_003100 [Pyrocoelia pectoralis]|uniref:DUF4806 domain-containing protein n=1 Tax=Pyrocoelia pectoralis TaxID=417401 RepID=A0AAN7VQF3_9COLE
MAFVGVEFIEDSETRVALVNKKWLTPRKTEVLCPPYKTQDRFNKALKQGDEPCESTWALISVTKCVFECDDYGKAINKLKISEYTSDVQTETEEHCSKGRRLKKPSRYVESDEDSVIDDSSLPRPAKPSTPQLNVVSDKLLQQVLFIREQNKEIIEQNKQILEALRKEKYVIPNVPVSLPIKNNEDLHELSAYVSSERKFDGLTRYLSTVGGANLVSKVNNIIKRCITNKFATQFSFRGKRGGKRAFEDLPLKNVIVCAAKLSDSTATEKEIEDIIKVWLKHAPQRNKAEEKSRNGGENQER